MRVNILYFCGFMITTFGTWATPDLTMLQRALMVTPETAHNIDTIFTSNFADEVIQCVVAPGHCDVLPQGNSINLDYDGIDMSGKRICITNHVLFYVKNLQGSAGNPAIISNCGGISTITDVNKALWIRNSRYVKITGTGHSGHPIGLKLTGSYNTVDITAGSSDIEIDHVEITTNSQVVNGSGISVRSYPACVDNELAYTRPNFTQYNTIIRDNYIHDTGAEGLYIGTSHHQLIDGYAPLDCDGNGELPTPQADLRGVIVENNVLFNIGGDGIQIGAAIEDAYATSNLVLDYGMNGGWPHIQGFEVNPGTKLIAKNNWLETRAPELSGVALSLQGAGGSQYINNVFVGMFKGIHALRSTGPNNDSHVIWYNTFVLSGEANAASIWCGSEFATNQVDFANNLFVNSQMPWADRQFGTSNCWSDIGQWFSSDINDLGLANPENGALWPLAGSVLINQGSATTPVISVDFFGDVRVSNEPGAFSVK